MENANVHTEFVMDRPTNAWDWDTARLVSEEQGQMKVCMWWYLLYQTQHMTSCLYTTGSYFFMSFYVSVQLCYGAIHRISKMFSAMAQIILLLHREGRTPWKHFKFHAEIKQVFWKESGLKLQGNYWKKSRALDACFRGKSLCTILVHGNGEES